MHAEEQLPEVHVLSPLWTVLILLLTVLLTFSSWVTKDQCLMQLVIQQCLF